MSFYNGLDEFGNNAPRKIWHQGEGSHLRRVNKRTQARFNETEANRDTLRSQALVSGALKAASVIIGRQHCLRDLINVKHILDTKGGHLCATVGPNQEDGGLRVRVDERRTDGLIWRPV